MAEEAKGQKFSQRTGWLLDKVTGNQWTQQTQQTQQDTSGQQATGGIFLPWISNNKELQSNNTLPTVWYAWAIQNGTIKTNVDLPWVTSKPTTISDIDPNDAIEGMRRFNKQEEERVTNEYGTLVERWWKQIKDTYKKKTNTMKRELLDRLARIWQVNGANYQEMQKYIDEKEEQVLSYNKEVNDAFAEWEKRNMDMNVKDQYEWQTITKLLSRKDYKWAGYKLIKWLSENITMIPEMIVTAVAPEVWLPLIAWDVYMQESQWAFEDMIENGATYDQARNWSVIVWIANASIEILLERFLWWVQRAWAETFRRLFVKNIQREVVRNITKKWFSEILGWWLLWQMKTSWVEWLEEILQQLVSNAFIKIVNPDKELSEGMVESFDQAFWQSFFFPLWGWSQSVISDIQSNREVEKNADLEATKYVLENEERKAQRMKTQKMKNSFLNPTMDNWYTPTKEQAEQRAKEKEENDQYEEELRLKQNEEVSIENSMIDEVLNDEEDSKYQKKDSSYGWNESSTLGDESSSWRVTITPENSSEITKSLDEIKKNLEDLKADTFLQQIKNSISWKQGSNYITTKINGQKHVLRVSDHNANAFQYIRGKDKKAQKTSIVIKLANKSKFKKSNKVDLVEFVYDPANMTTEKMQGIIDGIQNWIQTGEYTDTNYDSKNQSTRKRWDTKYQLKYEEKWYKPWVAGKNEKSISGKEWVNLRSKLNKQTIKQLAEKYWIKVEVIEWMIEILENGKRKWYAYGKYIDQLLTLSEEIKESTAPHELLHAIFDMIDPETKAYLISQVMKSEGWSAKQAEEWLADSFSNFYRTGKIEWAPKSTWGKIKMFFKRVRSFINWLGKWRSQLEEIFTDIIESEGIEDLQWKIDQSKSLNEAKEKMRKRFLEYAKNAEKTQKRSKKNEAKYQTVDWSEREVQAKVIQDPVKWKMYHVTTEEFENFRESDEYDDDDRRDWNDSFWTYVTDAQQFFEDFTQTSPRDNWSWWKKFEIDVDIKKPVLHPDRTWKLFWVNKADEMIIDWLQLVDRFTPEMQKELVALKNMSMEWETGEEFDYDNYPFKDSYTKEEILAMPWFISSAILDSQFVWEWEPVIDMLFGDDASRDREYLKKKWYDAIMIYEWEKDWPIFSYALFYPNRYTKKNLGVKYQEAEDIEPNIQSPNEMVHDWGWLMVIDKFISEKQKEKAYDVSKDILVHDWGKWDGHPYMWMHTNKYSSKMIPNFENTKDNRYKEFSDKWIVVSFFTNNDDMSKSYADQRSVLANTKKFKSIEEFNKMFRDDSNWTTSEISGDPIKTIFETKIVKDGDEYVIHKISEDLHKYTSIDDMYKKFMPRDRREWLSDSEKIKEVKQYAKDAFMWEDFDLYDWVEIIKDNGDVILRLRSDNELWRYKSEKGALANARSLVNKEWQYHYKGIIQNMHNPLVVDEKIYGNTTPYWNDLGNAYDFLKKQDEDQLNKLIDYIDYVQDLEKKRTEDRSKLNDKIDKYKKIIDKEVSDARTDLFVAKQEWNQERIKEADQKEMEVWNKRQAYWDLINIKEDLLYRDPDANETDKIDSILKKHPDFKVLVNAFDKYGKKYYKLLHNELTRLEWFIRVAKEEYWISEATTSLLHWIWLYDLSWEQVLKSKSLQTNDYVFYALRKWGYDGVIFWRILDYGGKYIASKRGWNVLVTFKPNQFKSWDNADPTDSEFISYQKMESDEVDNDGRKLSNWQAEYFEDSKVRDGKGNLLRVYHGTQAWDFTIYQMGKNGLSNSLAKVWYRFTPNKQWALNFAKQSWRWDSEARADEVYLNIANPKIYEASEFNLLSNEEKEKARDKQRKIYNEKMNKAESMDYTKAGGYFGDEYSHSFYERAIFDDLKRKYEYDKKYEWKYWKYDPEEFRKLAEEYNRNYDAKLDYDKILKDFTEYEKLKEEAEKEHEKYLDMKYDDPYEDFQYDIYKIDSNFDNKWTKWDLNMALNDYTSPEKFREKLISEWYDGIIIKQTEYDGNVIWWWSRNDQYVAFYPNQIKRITNLTPSLDADIRYQEMESDQKDNEWRTLSNGQVEHNKNSKIRDKKGNLLRVYHGTNSEYTVYDSSLLWASSWDLWFFWDGWYFATHKWEARYYGRNVMEWYLNITNPFYYGNMSKIWDRDFGNNVYVTIRNLGKIDESINSREIDWYKVSEIWDMVDDYLKNVKLEKLNDATDPYNWWDITYWKVTEYWNSEIQQAMKWLSENGMLDEQLNHYMMDKVWYLKPRDLIEEMADDARFDKSKKSFSQILQDKWYDGIVVWDTAYETDEIVAFRSNQFKNIDNLNPTDDEDIRYQRVYHWSPNEFDRFDSSHMWEWEWAQAHGWGHYVAVDPKTARTYAEEPFRANEVEIDWKTVTRDEDLWDIPYALRTFYRDVFSTFSLWYYDIQEEWQQVIDRLIKEYEDTVEYYKKLIDDKTLPVWVEDVNLEKLQEDRKRYLKEFEEALEFIRDINPEDIQVRPIKDRRNFYEVEIPDPVKANTPTRSNYLEEWKPITRNQYEKFKNELEKYVRDYVPSRMEHMLDVKYEDLNWWGKANVWGWGSAIYDIAETVLWWGRQASKFLESLGYKGIHYFWGRDGEAYVIFDDNDLEIKNHERYQIAEYDYDENWNRKWLKFWEDNSEFDPSIFDRSREDQIASDIENEKSNPFYNAWVRYNNQNYKDDQLTLEEFMNEISKRWDKEQEEYNKKMRDLSEAQNDPLLLDLQLRAVKLMEEEGKVGKKFWKNVSKEVKDRQQREVESKREKLVQDIVDYMYPWLKTEEIIYDMQKDADQKEAEWEMLWREDIEEKLKYFKKDKNWNREAKEIKVENPDIKLDKILSAWRFDEIITPVDRVIEWRTPQGQHGVIDNQKDPKKYKSVMEKINSGKAKTKVTLKDVTQEYRALEKYRAEQEAEKERKKKERQEAFAKKQQEEYKKMVRMKAFQRLIDMQWLEKYPFLTESEIKQRYWFTDEEWKKVTEQDEIKLPKKRWDKARSDFNKAVDSEIRNLIEWLGWQNNMKQREAEKNLWEIWEIDIDVLLWRDEEKGAKEVEEFEKIAKEEKKKTKKEKTKRLEQAREDVTKVEIDKERENSKSEKERVDKIIKSTKSDRTVWWSIKEFASDLITPVSTRLKEISPKIYRELMKYFQNKDILTNQRLKEIDPFLKAMWKIRKENPVRFMDIWVALANRNIGYANGLLQEYGVKVPTKLLDTIYDEAEDVGLNINYLGSYYPLSVKSPKSFLEELMKVDKWDIASEIEKKIQEESVKKGWPLDESEVTAIINSVIAWEEKWPDVNVGNRHLKKRNTEIKRTPQMLEYCDDPISTLIWYVEWMTQSIERAKFLWKSRSWNVHTLADYVYNAKNGLTPEQQDELMELLKSVFNDAGTHPAIQLRRDIATLTTLWSPSSTLTQLSDLSFSIYENGWRETLKAVWDVFASRKAFDLQDMWVINRWEEYTNINSRKNWIQKMIHYVFTHHIFMGWNAFSQFDTFWKSTFIQSTWNKRRKRALKWENGDPQLRKDIMKWTDDEYMTDKIINDLRNWVFSEDVAMVMYMKLGNVQPLTKAQTPKAYLDNPNWRLFYQFKTFGIKQLDYVLQETKWNLKWFKNLSTTEKFLRVAQIANMVFIMTLLWVWADELKDITMRRRSNSLILRWLFDEDVGTEQIWDKTWDNILKLFGLSRYSIMQMNNGNWDKAISDIFLSLPAMRTVDNIASDIHKAFKNDGSINWRNPSAYQAIPVIWKYRYWIYWGGQDKQKEALKKSKKKKKSWGSLI